MKPGRTGLARLFHALRYSAQGFHAAWKNEAAFRQEVALVLVAFPASFWLARSVEQWLLLITPLMVLLTVELLNSAIESVVDRFGGEMHELSGRAKDMGSAAVLVCLLLGAMAWGSIAWKNLA